MADVVLKDASGEEQTYEGVEKVILKNAGENGGTTTYVSEHLIQNQVQADWNQTDDTQPDYIKNKPEVFETEDELPTVTADDDGKILGVSGGEWTVVDAPEGGSGAGGVTSWIDLADKPFYNEAGTIFKGTFQDVKIPDGSAWDGLMLLDDTSDAALVEGQTYTYIWDGVEYISKCFRVSGYEEEIFAIGNSYHGDSGEDNGQPVSIWRIGSKWMAVFVAPPADLTISGTYSCEIFGDVLKQLDDKYLKMLECQSNKNNLLPTATATSQLASSLGVYGMNIPTTQEMLSNWHGDSDTPIEGNIFVEFDGVTYECAQQRLTVLDNGIAIGNCTTFGGTGNNEPFMVTVMGATDDEGNKTYAWMVGCWTDTEPTKHSVCVYQKISDDKYVIKKEYIPDSSWHDLTDKPFGENEDGTVKQLDNKYLEPFDCIDAEDLLPSRDGQSSLTDLGIYAIPSKSTEEMFDRWHGNGDNTITGNIFVEFDGVTYECAQQRLTELDGGVAVGNCTAFGGTGNNEPFIITMIAVTNQGANGNVTDVYVWMIAALTDTAPAEHQYRVYQDVSAKWLLKEEYIPETIAPKTFILNSSTEGSTKKFQITVDDNGTISAIEVT